MNTDTDTAINIFHVPHKEFEKLGDIYPSGEYHLENPDVRTFRLLVEMADVRITYFEEDINA